MSLRPLMTLFALLAVVFAPGCFDPPLTLIEHPTPQNLNLRLSLAGWLVSETADQGIIAISLPNLTQTVVRPNRSPDDSRVPYIQTLAGPDRAGRIAFVEGQFFPKRYRLMVINRDGTGQRVLFDCPGDPIWDHVISKQIALSRESDIALISNMNGVQLRGALVEQGALQICRISDGSVRTLISAALDWGLYWFPDSRRLAYVALLPVSQIPNFQHAADGRFVASNPDRAPAVCILDLNTGRSRPVCAGFLPVVADDGLSLLFCDYQYQPHRLRLNTGSVEPVSVPYGGTFVALRADGTVIYQGCQTEGPPTFTKYYSPLAGRRELTSIKVGILNTSQYQTLLPSFDFRNPITFGP
jgi:hypothetical protein